LPTRRFPRAAPDFQLLFESAPGFYLVLTPELTIVAASDGYLRASRTERQAIIGRHLVDVFPDSPGEPWATGIRTLRASLERAIASGAPDSTDLQPFDLPRPESEGGREERRFWSSLNSPVFDEDGTLAYVIHSVQEILITGTDPAPSPELDADDHTPDGSFDRRPLVVVIEDTPEVRRVIRDALTETYRTVSVANGAHALHMVFTLRPDLVVCDLTMPELPADALVRAIRGRADFRTTPILLLSARTDEHSRIALLELEANDYVLKPYSVEEVRARARNLISAKLAADRNRRLQSELEERERRLEEVGLDVVRANSELEAFNYSVSHDLRAPIRAVDGFSAMLLETAGDALDDTGREYLARIRRAANRMNDLIDALLHLSRIGRRPLATGSVDVTALAREVVEELQRADPERRVHVTIGDGMRCDADPALLRIVLENLLENAWKFTRPVENARVAVGSEESSGDAAYFVRDNGVGFDQEYAQRLFAPFQRLHHESEFPGTGVGLATVDRIVRRHGGRIWVEAAAAEGATFWWTIGGARP
jgi:signal transduction histidine kinase